MYFLIFCSYFSSSAFASICALMAFPVSIIVSVPVRVHCHRSGVRSGSEVDTSVRAYTVKSRNYKAEIRRRQYIDRLSLSSLATSRARVRRALEQHALCSSVYNDTLIKRFSRIHTATRRARRALLRGASIIVARRNCNVRSRIAEEDETRMLVS